MWQYNYDYLCHSSSHKYTDKTWKNGRWYYTYDEKSGGVRRRESLASETNVAFKKVLDSMGLNLKAKKKVQEGTLRKGHRDKFIPDATKIEDRTNNLRSIKRSIAGGAKEVSEIKDRLFSNKERQLANAKAAEEEHSSKTEALDREQAYQGKKEAALEKYNTTKDNFKKAAEKVENLLRSKTKNTNQADINESLKYMESYLDDYKELLQEARQYNVSNSIDEDYREILNMANDLRTKTGISRQVMKYGNTGLYYTNRVRR